MPRRLRLNTIALEGFGPYRATTFDLRKGRIFNLSGPFGCGKSFVPEAIRYAIEGAALRDVVYDPKITPGDPAERTRVSLSLLVDEDPLEVWRTPSGASHGKSDVYATLGIREASRTSKTDITLLDVCLNPRRFFDVAPDARLRFLDRTFGNALGLGTLEEHGVRDPEVQAACLRSFKAGAAEATRKRRNAEQMAEAARVPRPTDESLTVLGKERRMSEFDPATLGALLEQKRRERDALQRVGVLPQAPAPSEVEAAQKAVAGAEMALVAANGDMKTLVMGESGKKAAKAREQKDTLAPTLKAIEESIRQMEADAKPCEKCGNRANGKNIETSRKDWQETKDAMADAERGLAVHASEERRLKEAVKHAQDRLDSARAVQATIAQRVEAAKGGGSADAIEAAKKADALSTRIRAIEALAVKVGAYHAAATAHEQGEERRARLMEEAAACKHAEDGIARLVETRGQGVVPQVQQKVAAIAERLEFACALADDGEVLVKGAPIGQASRGQQLYAGIVLGAALASLSGIRFLFIDDLPSVDAWARLRLFRVLRALTQGDEPDLEQVFLVTLSDFARWCPKCQMKRVAEPDGGCGDCKKNGEATQTRIMAPTGPLLGVYRIFEFKGPGVVEEVL